MGILGLSRTDTGPRDRCGLSLPHNELLVESPTVVEEKQEILGEY